MLPEGGRVRLFDRGSWPEVARITQVLRTESVGGGLLLVAAVLALVWANSPWAASYSSLLEVRVGPSALHLDLQLRTWAADGLLAIFFFVAGLELKREFVTGDLSDPRRGAVPVAAAFGGVLVPAALYLIVNMVRDGDLSGWAVPTATDIAFALAVLAVVGSRLPAALRTFLLTLAVVDDLLAITIIAVFYTEALHFVPLLLAFLPLLAFAALVQRRITYVWLLLPLALATWVLVHESGVHATVAGVLLAFAVPVRHHKDEADVGLAEELEHLLRPVSAGFAVPVFALFAAGVTVGGLSGLGRSLADPVAIGVVLGLVFGKLFGVFGATWLVARFTGAGLDDDLGWWDVLALSALSGVGFTVSLLIGELAFGVGTEQEAHVKVAVLVGSVLASCVAAVLLRLRSRTYARLCEIEEELQRVQAAQEVPAP